MDETPLISVIVPIYNVAPYLRKCLDSLKGQTLKMESFRSTSYVQQRKIWWLSAIKTEIYRRDELHKASEIRISVQNESHNTPEILARKGSFRSKSYVLRYIATPCPYILH